MADSFTPHYNLVLPTPGSDTNTWGGLLNGNTSAIDTAIYNAQTTANNALANTGGALTGSLSMTVNGNVYLRMVDSSQTLPAGAWQWINGSDTFNLQRNTATAGDFSTVATPLSFSQADAASFGGALNVAGATTMAGALTVNGAVNFTDAGGITFAGRPAFGTGTPWDNANLAKPWADVNNNIATNYALAGSTVSMKFEINGGGFAQCLVTGWPNAIGINWNGTSPILYIDGNAEGQLWTSLNFNPGSYLTIAGAAATYVPLGTNTYVHTDNNHNYEQYWGTNGTQNVMHFLVDGSEIASLVGVAVSDRTTKKNIISAENRDSLAIVDGLHFKSFDYLPEYGGSHMPIGVIAQDVPDDWTVRDSATDKLYLNDRVLLMDALHAVKQLAARVRQLEMTH